MAGIAAAIKTGRLPRDRTPDAAELSALPQMDRRSAFVYYGTDETQNAVYALWCKADQQLLQRFFHVRCRLYDEDEWHLQPVDHVPNIPVLNLLRLFWHTVPWLRGSWYKAVLSSYPYLLKAVLEDS